MSATTTSSPGREEASQREACRASASHLHGLLKTLFPDVPSPDLLTLENVLRRYPLTGLGAPATAAIEQAQRIARARGDYRQAGLCEFHIGLIYLHFGDSRAAVSQFMAARNQWAFAGDAAAVCLTHYAQGVALARAFRFELAMGQFGRTEKRLSRRLGGVDGLRLGELSETLRPALDQAMEDVQRQLWPAEPDGRGEEGSEGLGGRNGAPEEPVGPATGVPEAEPVAGTSQQAGPDFAPPPPRIRPDAIPEPGLGHVGAPISRLDAPISRMGASISRKDASISRKDASISRVDTAPNPLRPMAGSPNGPVPGHQLSDDRYGWYEVQGRRDGWLPDLTEGTLLLVDSDPDQPTLGAGDLVVLGSYQSQLSSVILRPQGAPATQPYCFLVQPADEGMPLSTAGDSRFMSTEQGQATTFEDSLVLGVVIGSWHRMLG